MVQGKNKLFLRISQGRVFISKNDSISIECTSFNSHKMHFKPGGEYFWEIEITVSNHSTGQVELKVLDYNPIDIGGFVEQKMKIPVKFMKFPELGWNMPEPKDAFYHYNHLRSLPDDRENEATGMNKVTESHSLGRWA